MKIKDYSVSAAANVSTVQEISAQSPRHTAITIVNTTERFERLKAEWERLTDHSDAHIYQTYDWQRLWWKHFGGGFRLHILEFRAHDELIGIAPLYIHCLKFIPGVIFKRLRFIAGTIPSDNGSRFCSDYSPTDYLDIIAKTGYEDAVAEAFAGHLTREKDQYDEIDIAETPEDGLFWNRVVPALERRNWKLNKFKKEICPRIILPDSAERFLSSLKSSDRYKYRKTMKAVTKTKMYSVSQAGSPGEIREAFENFVRLHQTRWNRQGLPGIFADQRFTGFLAEISQAFHDKGWLYIKTASHNNQCLAMEFTFRYKNRMYDYQKAFDDASPLAKHRPGLALLYLMLEELIDSGYHVLDLLRGDEAYKLRIANGYNQNWQITGVHRSRLKSFRSKLFSAFLFIDNCYVKIRKEFYLMRLQAGEWGGIRFVPRYIKFFYERIRKKSFAGEPLTSQKQ